MAKTVVIGDIHGRKDWEQIFDLENNHEYTQFVFLGDYFDTHDPITVEEQMVNFMRILAFKKMNPMNVTLLLGNHDFHYLPAAKEEYSGFQHKYKYLFGLELQKAIDGDWIQMGFCIESKDKQYLFTHAGVTKTWYSKYVPIPVQSPDLEINHLLKHNPQAFRFVYGEKHSPVGDDVVSSSIWVRPKSLSEDALPGYVHIVGHTQMKRITSLGNVILVDTLGTSGEYLVICDGELIIKQIQK